jgi:hypothetical protein
MSMVERAQLLLIQFTSPDFRIRWVLLGLLYLVGVLYWMHSFGMFSTGADGGALRPEFGYLDWPRNIQIIEVIKDAVQRFELPYVSSMKLLGTDLLIAVPEVPITPQQALLAFVSTDSYILLNTLFMYSLGFIGLVLFVKYQRLSALTSSLLFGLFMFNGHVISHLAIGHIMWVAYFLLPYLMYLMFRMIDRTITPRLFALLLGGVLFVILQQGALHIYVFVAVFTVMASLTRRSYVKSVFLGVLISLALDMFRLLPAILHFDFPGLARLDGFVSPLAVLNALLLSHDFTFSGFGNLRWWEYDSHVGFMGLSVISLVCLYALRQMYLNYTRSSKRRSANDFVLLLPAFVLLVLSYGGVTTLVYNLDLPFDLNRTERVPSRFILMALIPAIFVTVVVVQRFLEQQQRWITQIRVGAIFALIVAVFELGLHALRWRVVDIEQRVIHPSERVEPQIAVEVVRTGYHASVDLGLAISLVALALWVFMLIRSFKRPLLRIRF